MKLGPLLVAMCHLPETPLLGCNLTLYDMSNLFELMSYNYLELLW